ncbi:MGMT family protein [Tersicoccus sp. MR15.9]|uniref:MGMT family protein n=1 Tax=Tersicoccus mangrovi TaxID=3121635 RepID=UPI002FE51586
MRNGFETAVLRVAAAIPEGRVLSYGDIADLLEGMGPRTVGRVMSRHGDDVPWWRVLRADGTVFGPLAARAAIEYAREGTPLAPARDGATAPRVRMREARWQPSRDELARLDRALAADGWWEASTPEHGEAVLSVPDDGIDA